MQVILQPAVYGDFEEIYLFSLEQFGHTQAELYLHNLKERIGELSANPHTGQDYNFIDTGLRRLVVTSHSIFYRVEEDTIKIIRVLHQSRDVERFL